LPILWYSRWGGGGGGWGGWRGRAGGESGVNLDANQPKSVIIITFAFINVLIFSASKTFRWKSIKNSCDSKTCEIRTPYGQDISVPISEMSSLLGLKSSEKIIFRPIVVSLFYRMSFCQGYMYVSPVSLYITHYITGFTVHTGRSKE
jgi:hypothetical protein